MYKQYPFNVITVIWNHRHEHNPSEFPLNESLLSPLQSRASPCSPAHPPCSPDHPYALLPFQLYLPIHDVASHYLISFVLLPLFSPTDWLYWPMLVLISRFCFHIGLHVLPMSPANASLPQTQSSLIKRFPESNVSFLDLTQVQDLGLHWYCHFP